MEIQKHKNTKRSYFAFNEYREAFLLLNDSTKTPTEKTTFKKVNKAWENYYHDDEENDNPEWNHLVIVDWDKKKVEMRDR
tara:strand:- start:308 stop:547 length:240 start_codon:yes stop_codon:yes gene_type:complete